TRRCRRCPGGCTVSRLPGAGPSAGQRFVSRPPALCLTLPIPPFRVGSGSANSRYTVMASIVDDERPSDTPDQQLADCEQRLGYQFQDKSLLRRALTHASGAQHRLGSNERLEFLGDAILG